MVGFLLPVAGAGARRSQQMMNIQFAFGGPLFGPCRWNADLQQSKHATQPFEDRLAR